MTYAAGAASAMRRSATEVGDARRQAGRVQAHAQHIDGRLQQFRRDAQAKQGRGGGVVRYQVSVPIDGERRIRFMHFQICSTASRAAPKAGSPRPRSAYIGAKPAAVSRPLRSRSGTSSRLARRSTISRLGIARPVSTKLRCRVDRSASTARSSWLRRRRWRQPRSWVPTVREADARRACAIVAA